MKYADFNLCWVRALHLADRLHNSPSAPEICYGSFHPTYPKEAWDERWQELYNTNPINYFQGFVHVWVEHNNKILDNSAMQFGEGEMIEAPLNDKRYKKFGIIDPSTGKPVPFPNTPEIWWDAVPAYSLARIRNWS